MASMEAVKPCRSRSRIESFAIRTISRRSCVRASKRLGRFDFGAKIMDLGIKAPDVALLVLHLKEGCGKDGVDRREEIQVIGIAFGVEIGAAGISPEPDRSEAQDQSSQ